MAAGAVLGLTLLGLAGLLLSSVAGLSGGVVAVAGVLTAAPGLLLARSRRTGRVPARIDGAALATALWFLALGALSWRLYDRALLVGLDGRLATGVDHNIGDLPFHVAIISGFVHGQNLPPEHPELAGTRLTYPILTDFVTAMLVRAGAGLRDALFLHNLVLGLALLGLLHRWARALTGDRAAALVAPVLVLFSGGLGFLRLLGEVDPSRGLVGHLPRLAHDYTILASGELRWGNVVTTMLIPQRSFFMGLPLFLIVWTLWWRAVGEEVGAERRRRRLTAAGIVAGALPLVHVHAFAVALGAGACLAILFPPRRDWVRFFLAALALAAPQLVWLGWGSRLQRSEFLDWALGWDRGGRNALGFWLANLGLYLPAGALALAWPGRDRVVSPALARLTVPFLFCFLVPNVLRLSPWIWDNIKFLIWWHVAWAPPVALLLVRLWKQAGSARAVSVLAGLAMVLSGALDVWRVASRQIEHTTFPGDGVAFADAIREATPPRAVILHAPTFNSEVYLTGRRSVLGYPGHIWSQGLQAGTREEDVRRVYEGGDPAPLARYGVDYVLVGPLERAWTGVDEDRLRLLCPPVAERGRYLLLRCPRREGAGGG